ncbi:GGDEF domain-containing protein [Edaphobacter sp. DSM 109919]|uniref:diguanylate cyclase n=1 Tax=Edaphobacter paludis TaxID=3035702 RepID=A0AAU7CZY9_9BACT
MADLSTSRHAPLKPSKVIPLLVISAIGALIFTVGGGLIVYSNTRHLIEIRNWLDHSQTVINNLQLESQRLDRLSSSMQLYQATGDINNLRAAGGSVAALRSGVFTLQNLLQDNTSQERHVDELDTSVEALTRAMESARQSKTVPDQQIQSCRNVISLIQEEERGLLTLRSNESQASGVRSLLVGAGYLGLSLIVLIVLFAFLIRDALRRKTFEKQLSLANDRLEATIEALERRGTEASHLKATRDELHLCVTAAEAQACSVRHLQTLVPGSSGATLMINNSRSMLEIAATWNDPSSLAEGFAPDACCGLRAGHLRWRSPGHSSINCSHFIGNPPENYVCIPLAAHGETLGFVYLTFPTQEIADLARSRILQINEMVELAAMTIAALNLRTKLENQSIRDGLTHLFNRHFMAIALEREVHRALRSTSPLAVLMLDVDHFKAFNDAFGHEAGDAVLREVADCFRQSVRSEDVVCRYGGEEFIIILPETDEETAVQRAEVIRQAVSRLRVQFKGQTLRQISLSIGIAMYPSPARDSTDLVRVADRALYDAKHAGRDRVHVAHEAVTV